MKHLPEKCFNYSQVISFLHFQDLLSEIRQIQGAAQAAQTLSASQVVGVLPALCKESSALLHWLLYPECCGEPLAKAFSEIQAKKRNSRILREK